MRTTRALAFVAAAAACSTGTVGVPADPPASFAVSDGGASAAGSSTTFHEHVEPILQSVCQRCHVAAGIAPFPLVSYDDAKAHAEDIVHQTSARTMPPWGAEATGECAPPLPWKDDLRLTDDEVAIFAAWKADGMPEGDLAKALPPKTSAAIATLEGGTSLVPEPYALTSTSDTFRCFVLDPKFAAPTYLNATFFVPKNRTIVHHALAYAIPPGAKVPAAAYDCFGGANVNGADLVAAWAPGGAPTVYPDGVALPLAAGTKFVVQIHYHPHANATMEPDATAFQFRTTNVAPRYVAVPALLGNYKKAVNAAGVGLEPDADDRGAPEFRVPATSKAHVETMKFTVPNTFGGAGFANVRVLGVAPHMHLAAFDQRITLTPKGSTADTCLVQVPKWNFDWQRNYFYDAPIESLPEVHAGDVIRVRCTFDNSEANTKLAAARAEASVPGIQDISLGESTLDEMCLGAFTFVHE